MGRIAVVYGAIAGAVIIASMITGFALSDGEGFGSSQAIGYLFMIVALSLIFLGIKRYRDQELGGVISFWKAFQLGIMISLVASAAYIICWEIYLAATDYAFADEYVAGLIEKLNESGLSQDEIDRKVAQIKASMENYGNPFFRVPITFLEIFPVAFLITLISSAVLRNPKILPARG